LKCLQFMSRDSGGKKFKDRRCYSTHHRRRL